MSTRIALLGLVLALLPVSAPAKDFEKRVAAESGGRLEVDLASGSVIIETHTIDEVRVDALAAGMGSRSLDIDLTRNGDRVRLRGGAKGWLGGLIGDPHVRAISSA